MSIKEFILKETIPKSMENQHEPNGLMGIYLIDIYVVYIAVISVISSIMLYTPFL